MRFRDLDLLRFGTFSDRRLDFSEEGRCFHVIYGPNEAGKSTALRAIVGLLFGIDEKTRDAHRYAPSELRVGAELENRKGETLRIVRRKGRKNTLLDAHQNPIEEARLKPFLGGMNPDVFKAMFGMDHPRLVQGGADLLAGRGEIGEALFGAASGVRGLHALVGALESEAAGLFKPTGRTPPLNQALGRYREARAEIKQRSLRPSAWEASRRQVDEALADLARLRESHAGKKLRLEQRRTLQAALPDLRERSHLLRRRDELGAFVNLPDTAADERRTALELLRSAQRDTQRLLEERTRIRDALAGLELPESLLAEEGRIAAVQDRRAVYRRAASDRRELVSRVEVMEAEVERLLRDLPAPVSLADIETIRMDAAAQARLREMARTGHGLQSRTDTLRQAVQAAIRAVEEAVARRKALPPEVDLDWLRSAVAAARRAGDLEAERREVEAEIAGAERTAWVRIESLPLWNGSLDRLAALPVPADETIEHFDEQLARIGEAERRLEEGRTRNRAELDAVLDRLAATEAKGQIPDPDALRAARGQRDWVWQQVRSAWIDGTQPAEPPDRLASSYEAEVQRSDELADRMFAEHERVALQEAKIRIERSAKEFERDARVLQEQKAAVTAEWQAAWAESSIEPRLPREMRAWRNRHRELVAIAEQIETHRTKLDKLDQDVEFHRSACLAASRQLEDPAVEPGLGLAALLETAERTIEQADARQQESTRRQDAVESAQIHHRRQLQDLQAAERQLEAWRHAWGRAVAPLHLDVSARPAEAEALLDKVGQIFEKHAQIHGLHGRIQHIDRDGAEFESEVEAIVTRACPELVPMTVTDRADHLIARFERAREARSKARDLREQLETNEAHLKEARRKSREAEQSLAALQERAQVTCVEDLEAAERRSAEAHELSRRLQDIEDRLHRINPKIEELVREADSVDEASLNFEIEQLTGEVEVSERERDEKIRVHAELQRDFQAMDGGMAASEAAEEAEEALARISHLTAEVVRKTVAALVLRREIQRFAEENQGPILERTSAYFQRMTLGRYQGITSGFSEDDRTVLLCQRSGGERVVVEGLSDGTRDQLYLALRLAALEHHVEQNEPMPLIVDDVLVTFDDPRSLATLALMGELSRRSQILFFTHHARLVELAENALPADRLQVHDL